MPAQTFIDANVPVYAAGRPHPLKQPCAQILELVGERPEVYCTDAEVLQELLHRYLALHFWPQARGPFARFATLMQGRIEPVYAEDVQAAARLADRYSGLSARDLLHLAVMARVGANQIISADQRFDTVPSIERLDPARFPAWRDQVQPS
jgi:predicted nucleic acid-binding protein